MDFKQFIEKYSLDSEADFHFYAPDGRQHHDFTIYFEDRSATFDYFTGPDASAEIEDVLYCLTIDSTALTESFEDWCLEFGYNNDSIKALGVYNACQANANKLKTLLGESLFNELLECHESDA